MRYPVRGPVKALDVDLDHACKLLTLPRALGNHSELDGELVAGIGPRNGYVRHNNTYYTLAAPELAFSVSRQEAEALVTAEREERRSARSKRPKRGASASAAAAEKAEAGDDKAARAKPQRKPRAKGKAKAAQATAPSAKSAPSPPARSRGGAAPKSGSKVKATSPARSSASARSRSTGGRVRQTARAR